MKNGANATILDNELNTPLHLAVHADFEKAVQLLAKDRACLDIKNKNGYTALHLSVLTANEPIVKLLLQSGANVNILTSQRKKGQTALHLNAFNSKIT